MRIETIIKTYVSFNELTDEQKQIVADNFDIDGQLYEHCMEERIDTLKSFATYLKGNLDYSISCVPDRGEFIEIKDICEDEIKDKLTQFVNNPNDCPLTGVYYDEDLRESLKNNTLDKQGLKYALQDYLNSIHSEYESMLTLEYIEDMCNANDYEFDLETLELA